MPSSAVTQQTLSAVRKAIDTDRWTEIMLRALTSRVAKRWRFISFRGSGNREWRGIVDVVAIRKDTGIARNPAFKRGDLFDLILIQMKGGSAGMPTADECRRLLDVKKYYKAKAVVLFQWDRGRKTEFGVLNRKLEWERSTCRQIFG